MRFSFGFEAVLITIITTYNRTFLIHPSSLILILPPHTIVSTNNIDRGVGKIGSIWPDLGLKKLNPLDLTFRW